MRLIILLLAIGITGRPIDPPPSTPLPPCRLKVGVAIGCLGDQFSGGANAVDLFTAYGFNTKRLMAPATQSYLQRFGCFRLIENGSALGLRQNGYWPHATPDDIVKSRFMQVRTNAGGDRLFWMAEPYLAAQCPQF